MTRRLEAKIYKLKAKNLSHYCYNIPSSLRSKSLVLHDFTWILFFLKKYAFGNKYS